MDSSSQTGSSTTDYQQAGPSQNTVSTNSPNKTNISSTQHPSKSDKYAWGGSRICHGFQYEKDLSHSLFVAATLEERSFRLATEMQEAGKLDDAVLILDDRKEIWLFQAKHSKSSKDTIRFNDFFPKNIEEKSPFSLPMYIQSYFNVLQNGEFKDFKKRAVIFTNKTIDESARQQLEKLVNVKKCTSEKPFENDLLLSNCEQPKEDVINDILDLINKLPIAVMNAIKECIRSDTVESILRRYQTPLKSMLEITENPLKFSKEFTASNDDDLNKKWYKDELKKTFKWDKDGNIKLLSGNPLKTCKSTKMQLGNKSVESSFPRFIEANDLKTFFDNLLICTNQPDRLDELRDMSIKAFIEKWVHRKEHGIFIDMLKFRDILEKRFDHWYSVNNMDGMQKKYLSSKDGNVCVDMIKAEIRNRLQKFHEMDFGSYVERTVNIQDSSKNEKAFIEMLESDRKQILILVGEPGIGKTTFMKKVAFSLQADKHVYLISMSTLFKTRREQHKDDIQTMFKGALSESTLSFLRYSLKHHPDKCIIMLDGFDEMDTSHQPSAIRIIKEHFCRNDIPVFISGRNYVKEKLQKEFKVQAMNFISLVEAEQMQFLRMYWEVDDKDQNKMEKFNEFAKQTLTMLHKGIKAEYFRFTGLPLIVRMLAEINKDKFENFMAPVGANSDEYLPYENDFSLLKLFESFVSISFNIIIQKSQNPEGYSSFNTNISNALRPSLKQFDLEHQLAAIEQMKISVLKSVTKDEHSVEFVEYMQQIQANGERSLLINILNGKRIEFVHLSYAEYFVAKYLYENVTKCEKFLIEILEQHEVVRTFFFAMVEENFDDSSLQMAIVNNICYQDTFIVYLACQGGHENIVKKLLAHHNAKLIFDGRGYGGTLLHAAVRSKNENLVSFLCECHFHDSKINIDTPDQAGCTPIFLAVMFNLAPIVKVLLDNKADDQEPNKFGCTPLHAAASRGYLNVVKTLLENNSADINTPDNDGQTILHLVAFEGRLEIAKMLIEDYSADIRKTDKNGQNALHVAAIAGQRKVVKMLVDNFSADIHMPDNDGRTALHWAAYWNRWGLVQMLIKDYSADINKSDNNGQTALHLAAAMDNRKIVKLLIDKFSADMNNRDNDGNTPLQIAAHRHHLGIVKLLTEKSSANINTFDSAGRTLLHLTAHGDPLGNNKLLIDQLVADSNTPNNNGQTALHLAVSVGSLEMVKKLIANYSANINTPNNEGRSPLHLAAFRGHLAIMKLLIDVSLADVNTPDNDGQTFLHLAASEGHYEMVKMLITEHPADINIPDKNGQTPLHLAAKEEEESVMKLLIDKDSAGINFPDNDGRTPFLVATYEGSLAIVTLLIDNNSVDINTFDNDGRAPLHLAAFRGRLAIMKMLMDKSSLDINTPDNGGSTPLHLAAKAACWKIVKILIQNYSVDIKILDKNGLSALQLATQGNTIGHLMVAKLLKNYGSIDSVDSTLQF